MHVWDEFSEFLPENRVPTSADFNTYPIRFFLMFQDMNCGAQTCLFTYLHVAAGRVLARVSTAEPFFLRIRRRGTVQNDRQSAWNSSIWKQMESATTKNQ